jgi:hypothetical protein
VDWNGWSPGHDEDDIALLNWLDIQNLDPKKLKDCRRARLQGFLDTVGIVVLPGLPMPDGETLKKMCKVSTLAKQRHHKGVPSSPQDLQAVLRVSLNHAAESGDERFGPRPIFSKAVHLTEDVRARIEKHVGKRAWNDTVKAK